MEIRRQEAPQSAMQPPMYNASANAVPKPVPIPTQTSLLMPAVSVNSAVANLPGHRITQLQPAATPDATNPPPPSARPELDPDNRDLLLKSANRSRFTKSSNFSIRGFIEYAEYFLEKCERFRDRWARFIGLWLCANEVETTPFSFYL